LACGTRAIKDPARRAQAIGTIGKSGIVCGIYCIANPPALPVRLDPGPSRSGRHLWVPSALWSPLTHRGDAMRI